MSSQPPGGNEPSIDPIEQVADRIARENVDEIRHLLPSDMADELEELIAVSLAYHPNLRSMTRRLVADPTVGASGDVPAPGADAASTSSDDERGTGSRGK